VPETSGGAIIARMLEQEGVENCFGIVDGTYTQLFAHCVEQGIEMVSPRHEAIAAHMAGAYARLTPGVHPPCKIPPRFSPASR